MVWLYLALAIVLEVLGTVAMKLSDGFRNLWFGGAIIVLYGLNLSGSTL